MECPKCKAEIDCLISPATATDNAIMNDEGVVCYPEPPEWETIEWSCPECNEVLFYDIDDAEEFMKNEDELKVMLKKKIKKEKK